MSAPIRASWLVSLLILAACSSGQSSNNNGSGGAPTAGAPASGSAGLAAGGAASGAGGVSTGGTTGGVATGGSGCVTPQALCDGACVDTSSSTSHCGMCGKGCLAAEQCSSGVCKCQNGPSGAPLTACTNGCTDTASDNANCGACGTVCPTGQVCSQGKCGTMCAATETACSTGCVDTAGMQQNPLHCGTCGNACAAGRVCLTGSCQCPTGTTQCDGECVDTKTTEAHCGECGKACGNGQTCDNGTCMGGTGGAGGAGGTGGTGGTAGAGGATGGGGSGGMSGGGTGGSAGSSGSGSCEQGSTTTQWATTCRTTKAACTAGTWSSWGSSSPENYPLKHETEHFAFLWPDDRNVSLDAVKAAGQYMEDVLWKNYLGSPIFWPEPYCNTANKLKTSVHIIQDGLYGGCNNGRPGIWVGPGAMADHWGLGHEWMHALQCMSPGFADCGGAGCWIAESHANFMPHQLPEYRTGNNGTHCSEMLANEPHLYYGSTRDRYCNWQFFEFLKDKHCYEAVNEMWTETAPNGQRDPWNKLALNMGWNAEQLNDLFGEWAMHNITWDYKNPPPTDGSNQGTYYRQQYGSITSTTVNNNTHRRHRLTRLEPLDTSYAQNHRFVSPYYWAPQRWGYNVVRLFPTSGSKTVTVKFRGVTQAAANSGWRWGLVATDANITTPRYSPIKSGADGELTFCVNAGESLFLVVVGAPTQIQKVVWDQAYPTIYRYPYMVELTGAWPEGFQNGAPDACPAGTQRHSNGGGCAPSSLSTNVYVGPYAQVLGGNVSGNARIEDQAVILSGATVSGGTVGALSTLYRFTVSDTAKVQTTFYPPGFFESGQGLSGTARLFGDVEYRGGNLNRNSGSFYGFVDSATASATINDVTVAPPYAWRN